MDEREAETLLALAREGDRELGYRVVGDGEPLVWPTTSPSRSAGSASGGPPSWASPSAAASGCGPRSGTPTWSSAYRQVAPRVEDWPVLVRQVSEIAKLDYDWSAEIPGLRMPVVLVAGDADGLPPSHAVEFFGLLGGGRRDANWDRSGMTPHRLAILPGVTHYDINLVPALSAAVLPFLDGA